MIVRISKIVFALIGLSLLFQINAFALFHGKTRKHDRNVKFAQAPRTNPYIFKGLASWYSFESKGIKKTTANNEMFDDRAMTCANWSLAFDQKVKVTNLANGKSVIVRVNDRGPHYRFVREGRVIDLTKGAFKRIADPGKGLINVKVEILNKS